MKVFTKLVIISSAILTSLSFADLPKGYYRVAAVTTSYEGGGAYGIIRIAGNNVVRGSLLDQDDNTSYRLTGMLNKGKIIYSPKPKGVRGLSTFIVQRNNTVVGVTGSYLLVNGSRGKVVGYKFRGL